MSIRNGSVWFCRALAIVVAGALSACTAGSEAVTLPAGPAPGDGVTRLAVIGDFGTGGSDEQEVSEALHRRTRQHHFAALVTTGDNVYPDGGPDHYDRAWRQPYGWTGVERLPVIASLGNHDVRGGFEVQARALLGMPARWYVRMIGQVQLIVLDANVVDEPEQDRFLRSTLSAPLPHAARFRVVVFHQPAYSCAKHQSTPDVIDAWVPLFAPGKVDLVLNGHDHVYERFRSGAVTYVVTGGGGSPLYELGSCPAGTPEPVAAAEQHHFLQLDVTDTAMRLRALTPGGKVLDDIMLQSARR